MMRKCGAAIGRFGEFAGWRAVLTPEFGKRASVVFFMLALLFLECLFAYLFCPSRDSCINPFIQGMWLYLAIFGLSLIPGGTATKILLSFWLAVMGLFAGAGFFLAFRFGLKMDGDCFFVLAASSVGESREFLRKFLSWQFVGGLLVCMALCCGMIVLVWKTVYRRSWRNTAAAILIVLPFVINSIRYIANDKADRIFNRSNLPRLTTGYFLYRTKLIRLLEMEKAPQLPSGIRNLTAQNLVGILVIGESANRSHWGAYGYPRDTTPQIDRRRGSCIFYDDMIACAAHTTEACYYMLTDARRGKVSKPAHFTVIDVLKAAGMRVELISNQMRWGKYDGPIGILAAHCDKRIYLHELIQKTRLDENVLPVLRKELAACPDGKVLFIVHLMGSHASYAARYPRSFSRFDNVVDQQNRHMSKENARELNEYDNSIAYTDEVLGGILAELEKESRPAFLLYVSDHSDCGAWSGHKHARSADSVVPDVYEIPCFLWFSERYRTLFPELIGAAKRNIHVPMQNDRICWALLSAMRVSYDNFPADADPFSAQCRPTDPRYTKKRIYQPSAAAQALWQARDRKIGPAAR